MQWIFPWENTPQWAICQISWSWYPQIVVLNELDNFMQYHMLLGTLWPSCSQSAHNPLVVWAHNYMAFYESPCDECPDGQFNCHHLSPSNLTTFWLPSIFELPCKPLPIKDQANAPPSWCIHKYSAVERVRGANNPHPNEFVLQVLPPLCYVICSPYRQPVFHFAYVVSLETSPKLVQWDQMRPAFWNNEANMVQGANNGLSLLYTVRWPMHLHWHSLEILCFLLFG